MKLHALSKLYLFTRTWLVVGSALSIVYASSVLASPPYTDVREALIAKMLTGDRGSQMQAKTNLVSYIRAENSRATVERDIAEMMTEVKQERSISQLRQVESLSSSTSKRRHDLAELLIANGRRFQLLVTIVEEEYLLDLIPSLIENIDIASSLGMNTFPIEEHYPAYAALKHMRVEANPLLNGIENATATQSALLTQLLVDRLGRPDARSAVLERLKKHDESTSSSSEIAAAKMRLRYALIQIGGERH